MDENFLILIAGILLSLAFSYIPGFRKWFDSLDDKYGDELGGNYKRLIMLGAILLTTVGIFGLSCLGYSDLATCDQSGAWDLVVLFVWAMIANQATYKISPKIL